MTRKDATAPLAAIFGLSGPALNAEEKAFFTRQQPWGYILFARNIADAAQLRCLTDSLRLLSNRPKLPIFIDQEGGRVQRIKPPLAPLYPTGRAIGALYGRSRNTRLISHPAASTPIACLCSMCRSRAHMMSSVTAPIRTTLKPLPPSAGLRRRA
jgi:beta-glucosidase-like glycosyl hydrolase